MVPIYWFQIVSELMRWNCVFEKEYNILKLLKKDLEFNTIKVWIMPRRSYSTCYMWVQIRPINYKWIKLLSVELTGKTFWHIFSVFRIYVNLTFSQAEKEKKLELFKIWEKDFRLWEYSKPTAPSQSKRPVPITILVQKNLTIGLFCFRRWVIHFSQNSFF